MKKLYEMIYKRKSIRKFDNQFSLNKEELEKVKNKIENLIPLVDNIKVKFKIVERSITTAKHGEYCLLLYSENKQNYLLNAGYMLEQMDLYLESLNIGVCWNGMAKVKQKQIEGLDYVIMLVFGKSHPNSFRNNVKQFKRKKTQ